MSYARPRFLGAWLLRFCFHQPGKPCMLVRDTKKGVWWPTQPDPGRNGDFDIGREVAIASVQLVTSEDTMDVMLVVYDAARQVVREEPASAHCFMFITWDFVMNPIIRPVIWDARDARSLMQLGANNQTSHTLKKGACMFLRVNPLPTSLSVYFCHRPRVDFHHRHYRARCHHTSLGPTQPRTRRFSCGRFGPSLET